LVDARQVRARGTGMNQSVFSRLINVERSLDREKTSSRGSAWYQFRAAATIPPSTSVNIRGGWYKQGQSWIAQETAWYPAMTIDISDPSNFEIGEDYPSHPGNFTNASWYQPMVLTYTTAYFYDLYAANRTYPPMCGASFRGGSAVEYATALEAEQVIDGWLDGAAGFFAWGADLTLCALILQNNGVTGADGQILPIDQVNRGRSYIWRDMRRRVVCGFSA
jgi:hypothetical protein